ncbi:MAG: phenylacetate--CoA ligase family protein [bacterium]
MLRFPSRFIAAVCEPVWDAYERSERLRTYRELLESQWYEKDRLAEIRSRRLQKLVRHAAETSPFYGRRFAEAGIDPFSVRQLDDLRSLPLLTKNDVREHLDEILSSRYDRAQLVPAKTGGSTGIALAVYCDRRGVDRRNGAALRGDTWSGWQLGEPVAAVWGNPPKLKNWRNKVRLMLKDRRFYLDTMRIDDAAIEQFVREWRHWRPGLLYGHAHSLYILAEAVAARGYTLRPNGIVATSMMLLEHERELIEKTFAVPVTNRYGCEEVSLIGCECEQHAGMHLNVEHAYFEFLGEDGSPCAPGEDGRIVVTELVNFGMPMLRYEVGDRGIFSERVCPCGRSLPLLERVTGRVADFLRAADGSRVAGISLIENTLTRFAGIEQLQLVQEQPLELIANLVPGPGYDDQTARQLGDVLRDSLGTEMKVEIRQLEKIPQEPSGKYRFSICKI